MSGDEDATGPRAPEAIIDDLERMIESAAVDRDPRPLNELGPLVREHVETIRRAAVEYEEEGAGEDEGAGNIEDDPD